MAKNYISYHHFVLFFIFFTLISSKLTAQCAGDDNTNELICDVSNPIYQSVNLFSLLKGSPVPGGTWTGSSEQGLDASTGILNAQLILGGGTYYYTYTAPTTSGCTDDKAVVTITIGAYVGVGSEATVCNKERTFNLFTAFDSKVMGPHVNGTFTTVGGKPVESTINIEQYKVKTTLNFIYTVPAVLACSSDEKSTNVQVTVLIAPEAGKPQHLELCGTTDLAGYTNLDLNDQLTDEDPDGTWTGIGITSATDHNINLQELFDANGPGEYSYKYTVLAVPNNYLCPDDDATVLITLEKKLDFTGSKIVVYKNICESEIDTATYSGRITQGPESIPDGIYDVSFNVVGPGVSASQTVRWNFVNGEFDFLIRSSYFKQVGEYTITVTRIVSTSSKGKCVNIFSPFSTILTIYPLPRLTNATLTALPICQNDAATIQVVAPQLLDGNYRISYNVNGDNLALGETAEMQFVGGKASFIVPGNLSTRSGLSVITIYNITNITNPSPQCTNTANVTGNLYINPLPNALTVSAAVKDYCLNAPVTITVSGLGTLTNASISYALSESNISAVQTISKAVTNGKLDFIIPAGLLLNSGATKITLLNLTNTVTNCDVDLINVRDDFMINPIPDAPIAQDMEFCKSDNATAADLVPSGAEYKWYNSATLTTPLATNYVLKTEDYYVTETSVAGCTSAPTKVSVIIQPLPNLDNAVLTAAPICIGKEALIEVTAPQLLDGDYRIVYNINGDNVATGEITEMEVTAGKASFTISSNLSTNAGLSVITIVNIANVTYPFPQCSNTAFLAGNLVINPLPNASTVSVAVNDFCLNDPVSASISGLGNLTNASISYTLSESNSSGLQTISQAVVNGKLDFIIPAGLLLNAGTTKITLLNLTNTATNCDVNLSNVTDDFIINPIPSAPVAQNQKFCKIDEAEVANLVPNGNQYKWYNSPTSTTPLASTLALESGNYYVRETSAQGCTSEATTVLVTVDDSPIPVLNSEGQNFCGLNNPTISDLSNNTNVPSSVVWYDSPNNGSLLSSTTPLIEQGKYYGFNFSSTDCLSSQYIEVTVTLTDCDNVSNDFFIPDGFSPNGDGVNDSFVIKDIEFLYPNYTLEIYNRYGNGMYKGDNSKPAWDGKNYEKSGIAGGIAPNGVYFYVLHFNKDNKPPKQGRLYLNR